MKAHDLSCIQMVGFVDRVSPVPATTGRMARSPFLGDMQTMSLKWLIPLLCSCGVQTIERGYHVSVDAELVGNQSAALSIAAIELHACDPPTLSKSFAHSASSATRSGEPHVLRPGRVEELSSLAPAPGRYCELTLLVEPADDDAINIDDAMVGQSLAIDNTVTPGSASIAILLGPLVLADSRDVALHLNVDSTHWLDGIDTLQLNQVSEQAKLYSNVAKGMTINE